jgi:alanine racemase
MPLSVSRAIIDLEAYASNLSALRRFLPPNCGIIAVVKANAYGHGLIEIARRAVIENVQMLGVSTVEEGVQLHEAGIGAPILVLMQPAADAMHAAVEHGFRMMISHTSAAERLGKSRGKPTRLRRCIARSIRGWGGRDSTSTTPNEASCT